MELPAAGSCWAEVPLNCAFHYKTWEYRKDVNQISGEDAAWIDEVAFAPGVDTDGDGAGDLWEFEYLGTMTNQANRVDSDQDGISDAGEFKCHTDPTNRFSFLSLARMQPLGEPGTVSFFWTGFPGVQYQIERATNLHDAIPFVPISIVPGDVGDCSFTDHVEGPAFYRLKVE